jgi:Spy/CpxP family protein refolding chaperone
MRPAETPVQIESASRAIIQILLITLAICLISAILVVNAFSFEGRRGPDPEKMLSHLTEELALSDEQANQIRPILEAQAEKQRKLFSESSSGGDRRAMREQMKGIHEETDRQIESILTPEQIEQFQELRKRMRGKKRPMQNG